VNGHTGWYPASHRFLFRYVAQLPAADALDLVHACTKVRWIVVRPHDASRRAAWDAAPGIRSRGPFRSPTGIERLYEVTKPVSEERCRPGLYRAGVTVSGLSVEPATRWEAALEMDGVANESLPGASWPVLVWVTNRGSRPWAATAVDPAVRPTITLRWRRDGGDERAQADTMLDEIPIPFDVVAGATRTFDGWL